MFEESIALRRYRPALFCRYFEMKRGVDMFAAGALFFTLRVADTIFYSTGTMKTFFLLCHIDGDDELLL